MDRVLSLRELNRATLARQLLLERAALSIPRAIEHLAGLQAQNPNSPYIGLWSRLRAFRRDDLSRLVEGRQVVRATLMRSTLHLVTADDYLHLRLALQPALARAFRGFFAKEAKRLDLDRVVETTRAHMTGRPLTFSELRKVLATVEPDESPESLSYAVRTHLPLVQVPPAGTRGCFGSPRYAPAEAWLGRPLAPASEGLHGLIARYLAAFGPATRQDIEAWSGLPRLQGAVDELMPGLRTFRDERGRALLDLPDMPLPGPGVDAPARFLPEFDNLVLSHADRTRVLPEAYRPAVIRPPGRVLATFLVDGFVRGTWRIERTRATATLTIEPFEPLPGHARDALVAEGERLVRFVEDGATSVDVRLVRRG